MKKSIIFVLFIGIFILVSYLYVPSSLKELNQKINNSNTMILDDQRLGLIKKYGELISGGLPNSIPKLYFFWISNQRKISDLRIKNAISEIKDTKIAAGKIRVWSLLNMGAVVKTNKHSIAFDAANLPFSQAHNELVEIIDIFLVTHDDGDHYDPALLKKAIMLGKKVILPEGLSFDNQKQENIKALPRGETIDIDGVKITTYQTDHRGDGNFMEPNMWYVVDLNGYKLLHTGDGRDFRYKNESEKVYAMKDIDILLGNIMLHPYNIRDLKPKILVPLHVYKFMSGNNQYQESTLETVLNTHKQHEKDLRGINIVYLLPGESFVCPTTNP